jgi:hypothetical protein
MSIAETSAKEFLHFGHRYEVLIAFKGWFESFAPGERFVYWRSATSVYDSAIGWFFYDTTTGATRRYDTDWGAQQPDPNAIDFRVVLKDLGPDMEIRRFTIAGELTETNWSAFDSHVPYLLDYVQGKEGIQSWYAWLEENLPVLQTHVSRAQLLRLKNSGPSEAQKILTHLRVPFAASPRYGWT